MDFLIVGQFRGYLQRWLPIMGPQLMTCRLHDTINEPSFYIYICLPINNRPTLSIWTRKLLSNPRHYKAKHHQYQILKIDFRSSNLESDAQLPPILLPFPKHPPYQRHPIRPTGLSKHRREEFYQKRTMISSCPHRHVSSLRPGYLG